MGLFGPKGGAQGGAQDSPPKGLYKQCCATVARVNTAAPPMPQARGRLRGPSSPDRDASSRMCGYLGGAASAAQGRAAREEVLATALPASICTTPACYRSSATARLVVIPLSITAIILVYAVENFCFCYPIFLQYFLSRCWWLFI
jgi:hypothetical protein